MTMGLSESGVSGNLNLCRVSQVACKNASAAKFLAPMRTKSSFGDSGTLSKNLLSLTVHDYMYNSGSITWTLSLLMRPKDQRKCTKYCP
ncbi:hypothetical protein CC2G_008388 [Coprinopsis cinerea AmutBmut pab1-1]|nr:hypothetical protein CC2G_008388 [Coprinopsis cinerea AmutBmut pab1-1]